MNAEFKTLKDAKRAGYRNLNPGEYSANAISIKGHRLYLSSSIKVGYSKTAWATRGFDIKKGQEPFDYRYSHSHKDRARGHYGVFRDDQVESKPERAPAPVVHGRKIDIAMLFRPAGGCDEE